MYLMSKSRLLNALMVMRSEVSDVQRIVAKEPVSQALADDMSLLSDALSAVENMIGSMTVKTYTADPVSDEGITSDATLV